MSLSLSVRRVLAAALLSLGLPSMSVPAAAAPNGMWSFRVTRDGDPIGTHQMAFSGSDSNLQLDIHTRIAVKMMLVTVYRFEHDGQENWQNGQLVSPEY